MREPERPAELLEVDFTVDELRCHVWCPIRVDRALADLPTWDLRVDVDRRNVAVAYDPTRTTPTELQAALDDHGFTCRAPSSVGAGSATNAEPARTAD